MCFFYNTILLILVQYIFESFSSVNFIFAKTSDECAGPSWKKRCLLDNEHLDLKTLTPSELDKIKYGNDQMDEMSENDEVMGGDFILDNSEPDSEEQYDVNVILPI